MNKNIQKVNVLVIGGGIIGLSVASELQSRGFKVTLLEQGSRVGHGCSLANAGWVTPCFAMPLPQPGMFLKSIKWLIDNESPLHIQPHLSMTLFKWLFHFMRAMNRRQMERAITVLTEISKQSLASYKELSARHNVAFEQKGLLLVSATDEGVRAAHQEMNLMSERQIPGQIMGRDELLNFEPIFKPLIKGGVYFPEEAHLEPALATQALAKDVIAKGGTILTNAEVYDFESSRGRIESVVTTQGIFQPDLVVMAAGTWSPLVTRRLRIGIPVLGGKGYSMIVKDSKNRPKHPIMIVEKKIAITPREDSFRIAGTLELVEQDYSISPRRVNGIYKGSQEYMDFESERGPIDLWRGLRPCTPDGVPLIGFSKKQANLFYCTGHQMLGVQSAPGSALLAADLIQQKPPSVDAKPFSPGRFE